MIRLNLSIFKFPLTRVIYLIRYEILGLMLVGIVFSILYFDTGTIFETRVPVIYDVSEGFAALSNWTIESQIAEALKNPEFSKKFYGQMASYLSEQDQDLGKLFSSSQFVGNFDGKFNRKFFSVVKNARNDELFWLTLELPTKISNHAVVNGIIFAINHVIHDFNEKIRKEFAVNYAARRKEILESSVVNWLNAVGDAKSSLAMEWLDLQNRLYDNTPGPMGAFNLLNAFWYEFETERYRLFLSHIFANYFGDQLSRRSRLDSEKTESQLRALKMDLSNLDQQVDGIISVDFSKFEDQQSFEYILPNIYRIVLGWSPLFNIQSRLYRARHGTDKIDIRETILMQQMPKLLYVDSKDFEVWTEMRWTNKQTNVFLINTLLLSFFGGFVGLLLGFFRLIFKFSFSH